MEFVAEDELERAMRRYSQIESLFAPGRVCLVLADGRLADLRAHGIAVHRVTWDAPWYLRPIAPLTPFRILLAELQDPDPIVELAMRLDDIQFFSFSLPFLPRVLHAPASVAFFS